MSTTALARTNGATQDARDAALIKAIGFDRVPAEQRELAMHIAERYGLDLMLRHIVMVDGKPYITRDGLLHVAHRSGVFDGIEVTDPVLEGGYWRARATVYRKDMSRGIAYPGRYPEKGRNQAFGPEMAIKVGEVMALRRAFDVSAPVLEERWDMDESPAAAVERQPVPLAAKAAASRARIEARQVEVPPDTSGLIGPDQETVEAPTEAVSVTALCEAPDPVDQAHCVLDAGHEGWHADETGVTWR